MRGGLCAWPPDVQCSVVRLPFCTDYTTRTHTHTHTRLSDIWLCAFRHFCCIRRFGFLNCSVADRLWNPGKLSGSPVPVCVTAPLRLMGSLFAATRASSPGDRSRPAVCTTCLAGPDSAGRLTCCDDTMNECTYCIRAGRT